MSESASVNLLRRVGNLNTSTILNGYSKVTIYAGVDENGEAIKYQAGSDGGAELVINNPWGSTAMAQAILSDIEGWQYQPYSADGALLDPAAELGDGVAIDDIYSGVYNRSISFGSLMRHDISAPSTEEVEHEFTAAVSSSSDREFSRLVKSVNSRITQTASQIAIEVTNRQNADSLLESSIQQNAQEITARVKASDGDSLSECSWTLNSQNWVVKSKNNVVLEVGNIGTPESPKYGIRVTGEIKATSGEIGGFAIQNDYINYNGMTWESSLSRGIYIGINGIKLGQYFKVDTMGNLTANRITANGGTIGGIDIGSSGISGNKWSMSPNGVSFGSSGFSLNSSGVASISSNCRVNGGDTLYNYVGSIVADKITANYINSKIGEISLVKLNSMQLGGHTIARSTIDGNKVLTWI